MIRYNKQAGVLIDATGGPSDAILSTGIYGNGGPAIANASPTSIPSPTILSSVASTSNGVPHQRHLFGDAGLDLRHPALLQRHQEPLGASARGNISWGRPSITTDASGSATFTDSIPTVVSAGKPVTATATDTKGNTSVFSGPIVEVVGSLSFAMASYTASEGTGLATITVDRVGGSGGVRERHLRGPQRHGDAGGPRRRPTPTSPRRPTRCSTPHYLRSFTQGRSSSTPASTPRRSPSPCSTTASPARS